MLLNLLALDKLSNCNYSQPKRYCRDSNYSRSAENMSNGRFYSFVKASAIVFALGT